MTSKPTFNPSTGLIEFTIEGGQSEEGVRSVLETLAHAASVARQQGKSVNVLVVTTKLRVSTVAARSLAGSMARSIDFDKAAIIAGDSFSLSLVKLILRASGLRGKIHFFTDVEEGSAWLKK